MQHHNYFSDLLQVFACDVYIYNRLASGTQALKLNNGLHVTSFQNGMDPAFSLKTNVLVDKFSLSGHRSWVVNAAGWSTQLGDRRSWMIYTDE
jgi:hypothetical protein